MPFQSAKRWYAIRGRGANPGTVPRSSSEEHRANPSHREMATASRVPALVGSCGGAGRPPWELLLETEQEQKKAEHVDHDRDRHGKVAHQRTKNEAPCLPSQMEIGRLIVREVSCGGDHVGNSRFPDRPRPTVISSGKHGWVPLLQSVRAIQELWGVILACASSAEPSATICNRYASSCLKASPKCVLSSADHALAFRLVYALKPPAILTARIGGHTRMCAL